ncbi:MAG: intracellular septation protein A [Arenicella sp.]|jgi:intracellular septation protein A
MNQNTEVAENSDQVKKKSGSNRIFVDLVVCMLIPTLILKKLSGDDMLGPNYALVAALSLPLLVGIWGFISERKVGFVPALGFISILLTGSIGILKLPKEYIAYKEALIPGLIAIATVVSTYTKYPLVRTFLYNDTFMDTNKVSTTLIERQKTAEFDSMMVKATWMLASSFVLSSVLNFLLAKWIVVSESGTDAFNSELGTMNLYSYPVIVVPCMVITMFAMFYVFSNIRKLTGLKMEDLVQQ